MNLRPPKPIPLVVSACWHIGLGMHGFFAITPFSHCFYFQGFRFFLMFFNYFSLRTGINDKSSNQKKKRGFNICNLKLYFYVTDIQIGFMNKQSNFLINLVARICFQITMIYICPNTIFQLINILKYTTMYQMCIGNDMRFQAQLKTCYTHRKFDPR